MTEGVTRWAMIGTGGMALNIIRDFHATENVELTTVVSRSAENGAKFAAEWNIPNVISDYEDLWASDDIDVVYIATPHPSHFDLVKSAIKAGKHVLVEKPITMTADQARELADLAKAAEVFLMEAVWTRFNPSIRKIQELVAAGAIGTVRHVEASFGYPFPPDPESRMWKPELGGGTTLDQGVYTITIPYLIWGKPSSIVARGSLSDAGVDAEAAVLLGFPGGEQAQLSTSMTAFLPMTAAICGSGGQINIASPFWATEGFRLLKTDLTSEDFTFPKEGAGYVPMLRAVGEAIADGRLEHELLPLSETIEVMEIMEEVIRQIKEQ